MSHARSFQSRVPLFFSPPISFFVIFGGFLSRPSHAEGHDWVEANHFPFQALAQKALGADMFMILPKLQCAKSFFRKVHVQVEILVTFRMS